MSKELQSEVYTPKFLNGISSSKMDRIYWIDLKKILKMTHINRDKPFERSMNTLKKMSVLVCKYYLLRICAVNEVIHNLFSGFSGFFVFFTTNKKMLHYETTRSILLTVLDIFSQIRDSSVGTSKLSPDLALCHFIYPTRS